MKAKFHWHADASGIVVRQSGSVRFSVVNLAGRSVRRPHRYRLIWQGQELSFSPEDATATLELRVPAASGWGGTTAIDWELRDGSAPVDAGRFILIGASQKWWRRVALLLALFVCLIAALLVPSASSLISSVGAVVALIMGSVAVIKDSRDWLLRCLYHRVVAALFTAGAFGLLYFFSTSFARFRNLGLEPRMVGSNGVQLPPRGVVFDQDSQCASVQGPSSSPHNGQDWLERQPFSTQELRGWAQFFPWRTCDVGCRTEDHPGEFFAETWKGSDRCNPDRLSVSMDTRSLCPSFAQGEATVAYGDDSKSIDLEKPETLAAFANKFRVALFAGNFSGLDFVATSSEELKHVHYASESMSAPRLLLPFRKDGPGVLSFSQGSTPIGEVQFDGAGELACTSLTGTLGVQSLLLLGAAGAAPARTRRSLTRIDQPYWADEVPVCFVGREPPTRGELVLAQGWTPQAFAGIQIPCKVFPDTLNVRTSSGVWLATVQRGAQCAAPRLSVKTVDWRKLAGGQTISFKQLTASKKGRGEQDAGTPATLLATVSVPYAVADWGSLAWYLDAPPWRAEVERSRAELVGTDDDISVQQKACAPCYFSLQSQAHLPTGCPREQRFDTHTPPKALADESELCCSSRHYCLASVETQALAERKRLSASSEATREP